MAASLLALVLLAACGGEDAPTEAEPPATDAPTTETTAPETEPAGDGPPGEPPAADEGAPPPAWIEIGSRSAWMAYGSYNWAGATFDVLRASCDDEAVPKLEAGGVVRFHLPFEPATAELTLGADRGRPEVVTLDPGRTLEWAGDYAGHLWLALTAPEGEVAYQACVRAAQT